MVYPYLAEERASIADCWIVRTLIFDLRRTLLYNIATFLRVSQRFLCIIQLVILKSLLRPRPHYHHDKNDQGQQTCSNLHEAGVEGGILEMLSIAGCSYSIHADGAYLDMAILLKGDVLDKRLQVLRRLATRPAPEIFPFLVHFSLSIPVYGHSRDPDRDMRHDHN